MRSLFTLLLALVLGNTVARCQDTTNILFIGNSFTAANGLSDLVQQFYLAEGKMINTFSFAPGGISVGDVHMGTMAHMNNPEVFRLIREKDWDYLVLQDNQGRFSLDSARFPSVTASKVVEGHLKIRDSFHHYHSCGKMILFSGWGFKDEDIDMINRITVNYRVYNDSAKDVIAPIGPAWKRCIEDRPGYDLWDADGAHPGMPGSYLTAAVIYGAISGRDLMTNPFNYALAPHDATFLKERAKWTLEDPVMRMKSNLEGVDPIDIRWDKPRLKGTPGKLSYRWYMGTKLIATTTDSAWAPPVDGTYRLWTKDNTGCWQKSCTLTVTGAVSIKDPLNAATLALYPNPATAVLHISAITNEVAAVLVYDLSGRQQLRVAHTAGDMQIDISGLAPGMYLLKCAGSDNALMNGVQRFVKE